jgi:predicted DsbA family dithiol-disulfide isomerase
MTFIGVLWCVGMARTSRGIAPTHTRFAGAAPRAALAHHRRMATAGQRIPATHATRAVATHPVAPAENLRRARCVEPRGVITIGDVSMNSPIDITVFIDPLCPFAYRASRWLDQLQQQRPAALSIRWRLFSLEQVNAPADSDWRIWQQPVDYPGRPGSNPRYRALPAFWALAAAQRQGAAAGDAVRQALFDARHEHGLDLADVAGIRTVVSGCGIDMARFDADTADRDVLDQLRIDHEAAVAQYRAFGVPTICFDEQHAIYLKLAQVPPADDAWPCFEELRRSIIARPWLVEIKRPNA